MPWIDGTYYFDCGTTTSSTVWNTWTTTGTSTSITNYPAWDNWVTLPTSTLTYQVSSSPWVYTDPRTPEQIEAARVEAERQAQEWRAQEEQRRLDQQLAAEKARVLLEENLSDEQRAQLHDNNWFEVVTPKGTYRIRFGRAGNVDRYRDGRHVDRYCIHPEENVPNEDVMLAQKLLLETDEEAFLRIANRSNPYG